MAIKVQQLKVATIGYTDLSLSEIFKEGEIKCLKLPNQRMEGRSKKSKPPIHLITYHGLVG